MNLHNPAAPGGPDRPGIPFTEEELLTVLEAARLALADADTFDHVVDIMDITDSTMVDLREKLTSFLNNETTHPKEAKL